MKLTLRLPDDLYESLKALAREQGRSLNAEIAFLLENSEGVALIRIFGEGHRPDRTVPPPSHQTDTTEPLPYGGDASSPPHVAHNRSEAKRLTALGHPAVAKQDIDEEQARKFREKYGK